MSENILQGLTLLLIVKVSFLILIALFIVFLFIVFNQIGTLSKTIEQKDTGVLKVIAFILIILALSLFLTGLVIL